MKIPLQARLKRESYRKVAYAQDLIVKEIYDFLPNSVLHGGTGIWRCYNGNRFSEDLDFYLSKNNLAINMFFDSLEKKGFSIIKKKISENSVYSELQYDRVFVRFEATFQKIKGILCDYELSDGNIIKIYSLSAEDFIIEKIKTYLKRLKIRDLWDVFFLLKDVKNPDKIKENISGLIANYSAPIDEEELKTIILEGVVPSSSQMLHYIKSKWEI